VALAVDAVHAGGEWIRHAPHRSDLLGRAATPTDGRWQHGEHVPGLYLAEDAATAVAEWYRFLAELGIAPARAVPHDHHLWRLDLELADLSSARQLASAGLPPPRPGRATWAGLIGPSAARPDGRIACIFAARWPPERCTPIRANEINETPPPPQGMTT